MANKKVKRTFTFEIPEEFDETFEAFQVLAGKDDRSTAALLRVLVREHVEASRRPA